MDDSTKSKMGLCFAVPPQSGVVMATETEGVFDTPELITLVASEIHAPMEAILETAGRLLETELSAGQLILAEKLRRSGNALLTIINNLVDFSKIEIGTMRLQEIDFDPRTTLEQVKRHFEERGEDPKITCLVHHDVPTMLRGDPGRLRQILSNYLPFALQVTGGKEAILRASVMERAEDLVSIRFEVTPTEEGAAPANHKSGVARLSSEAMEYAHPAPGPGLGMVICRRLATVMDGTFGLDSKPGKASTAWFSVRLHEPHGRPWQPSTPRNDLRGLSALVVQESASGNKDLLAQTLSWGMSCDITPDAAHALVMLRSRAMSGHPYDLAILDMQMPEASGMELAQSIQSDPAISSVRCVGLIAAGLRGHAEELRQAGMAGYLTKPVGQSELYQCLTTVIGSQTSGTPVEAKGIAPLVTSHSLSEARGRASARVLVAEDNPVNQMVAVRMLEKLGVHADLATNGREAVEAVARTRYDLILMDCQMPEMDGFEATREILDSEPTREGGHIPIAAVTAHAMKGDREKCLVRGMDDYLTKPFDLARVRNLLARWIPDLPPETTVRFAHANPKCDVHLDSQALGSLRTRESDGAPDFRGQLVAQYLREARQRLDALHVASERADTEAILFAAHSLKGSSAVMGAKRMAALCRELEEQARLNEMKVARVVIVQMEEEFSRVREELKVQTNC